MHVLQRQVKLRIYPKVMFASVSLLKEGTLDRMHIRYLFSKTLVYGRLLIEMASDIYLCAIVKDEQLYIEHWLDYHFNKGIQQAVIYNNGNTGYNFDKYGNKVYVINWHPDKTGGNPQVLAYNNFLCMFKRGRCLFIDIDEYLFGELPEIGNVVLEDVTYDANGNYFYSHEPVTERFTREAKVNMTCNLKTYVELSNSGLFVSCHRTNAELRDIDGRLIEDHSIPTITSRTSYLRHYLTKSLEEYVLKLQRGNITKGLRTMEYFYKVNPDMLPQNQL